ncbi:MAG: NAD+ synthase, partial [Gammaproteobacteria bacterium]|nr:NAD+ synthase [Gammaproteobacteria bacterium]
MSQQRPVDHNAPEPINILMVQDVFQVGDIKRNADKIIDASIKASQQGVDLVVFPELALVGYPPEDLLHRQGFLTQIKTQCLRIQKSLQDSIGDTGVIFGLPIERGSHLYNAAVYLLHGDVQQICFKQSLPNYSVFDELRYFAAGSESTVINVKGHKLGVLI